MSRPLRIAMLAHSTNPRGSVVHALAVAEALTDLGHTVVVHAPQTAAEGFFRRPRCATALVPATAVDGGLETLVEARIADYVRYFKPEERRRYDVFHAQDGISGNALASLRDQGLIGGFVRTVHHVEEFADERIAARQLRSILAADHHLVVSRLWQEALIRDHGLEPVLVGNGVDRAWFTAQADQRDAALAWRLGIGTGPCFLAIGGVEARKNTVRILRAFARVHGALPEARLIIAGGVSLLDHRAYQQEFAAELTRIGDAAAAVIMAGRIAHDDLPALYRLADALVFPSLQEGFGLVVIESLACGTPAVVSRILPFTEHLPPDGVRWCDPHDAASIAVAMLDSLRPDLRARLAERAPAILAAHDWRATAAAHLPVYHRIPEPAHA